MTELIWLWFLLAIPGFLLTEREVYKRFSRPGIARVWGLNLIFMSIGVALSWAVVAVAS